MFSVCVLVSIYTCSWYCMAMKIKLSFIITYVKACVILIGIHENTSLGKLRSDNSQLWWVFCCDCTGDGSFSLSPLQKAGFSGNWNLHVVSAVHLKFCHLSVYMSSGKYLDYCPHFYFVDSENARQKGLVLMAKLCLCALAGWICPYPEIWCCTVCIVLLGAFACYCLKYLLLCIPWIWSINEG